MNKYCPKNGNPHMNNQNIYCSGPLFCPEEIAGMQAISQTLEKSGYTTYLPHRDGLEAYVLKYINTPLNTRLFGIRNHIDQAIFALDIYQIVKCCQAIVVNLNGRTPDEGAIVEASIAFSCNKPVLFYKNDSRFPFNGRDNAMILGLTSYPIESDIDAIPKRLDQILKNDDHNSVNIDLNGQLSKSIAHGERIWTLMKPLRHIQQQTTQHIENLIQQVIKSCDEFSFIQDR
jgi:nucleoside 2-deoxyribosyltransferase